MIDQACSVKMTGYWPSSFLRIKTAKEDGAMQSSTKYKLNTYFFLSSWHIETVAK